MMGFVMTNDIQLLKEHFLKNHVQVIDIHIGDSICFVLRFADVERLNAIPNHFPQFTIVKVLSSISNVYQYLFIK